MKPATLLCLVLVAFAPRLARAEDSEPIVNSAGRGVVLLNSGDSEFDARIQGELNSIGYDVHLAPSWPERTDAHTVAIVTPSALRVDVWLVNPQSGFRELHASVERVGDGSDFIRVAERLRGLFQRLPASPMGPLPHARRREPPADSAPPPPSAPAPQQPPQLADITPSRIRALGAVDAGAAVLTQPGGPALGLCLGARLAVLDWFDLGLEGYAPVTGTTVETQLGQASVSTAMIGAAVEAHFDRQSELPLGVRAGVHAAWLRTSGRATAPLTDQDDSLWTAVPFLGPTLTPTLGQHVALRASVAVGVSIPRADIRFANSAVATFGRPLLLTTLGLSFDL
ncbi:MAG: hypothetical protein R3B13_22785 [Polyangiaceae bacterium]